MRPLLHPSLVNGRSGDPALYVETLFERRAILLDLGDISALPPRKVQRLDQVFVSHAHIDHFVGFDRLLRLLAGREKKISLHGPTGFIDHVHHKLQAYRWNLVDRYACDLVFVVSEIDPSLATRTARFRLKNAFAAEPIGDGSIVDLDDVECAVAEAARVPREQLHESRRSVVNQPRLAAILLMSERRIATAAAIAAHLGLGTPTTARTAARRARVLRESDASFRRLVERAAAVLDRRTN